MKPRLLTSARLSLPLAAAIAALLTASSASATPYNWTDATDGTWNTTTNWSGGSVPLISDDLTILGPLNVAGALTINYNADDSARSLIFTNTAATSITNTTSGGITKGAGAVQFGANVANQAVSLHRCSKSGRAMAFASSIDYRVSYNGRFNGPELGRSTNGSLAYRHGGNALIVYFDGHDGEMSKAEIRQIDTSRGGRNNSFWAPTK